MKPGKVWWTKLLSRDRRKAKRLSAPPLIAYYWDGAVPADHGIRDISSTGLYLMTEQRWYPGTLVTMTLQKTAADNQPKRSIAVQAQVVRTDADGVGFRFLELQSGQSVAAAGALNRKALTQFLERLEETRSELLGDRW